MVETAALVASIYYRIPNKSGGPVWTEVVRSGIGSDPFGTHPMRTQLQMKNRSFPDHCISLSGRKWAAWVGAGKESAQWARNADILYIIPGSNQKIRPRSKRWRIQPLSAWSVEFQPVVWMPASPSVWFSPAGSVEFRYECVALVCKGTDNT